MKEFYQESQIDISLKSEPTLLILLFIRTRRYYIALIKLFLAILGRAFS